MTAEAALAALDLEVLHDDLVTYGQISVPAARLLWLADRAAGFGLRSELGRELVATLGAPAPGAPRLMLRVALHVAGMGAGTVAALQALAAVREASGSTPAFEAVLVAGLSSDAPAPGPFAACVVPAPTDWELRTALDPARPLARVAARALQTERARPTRTRPQDPRFPPAPGVPTVVAGPPEGAGDEAVATLARALVRIVCADPAL